MSSRSCLSIILSSGRGHPHEERHPESAAQDSRPADACPCRQGRLPGWRRADMAIVIGHDADAVRKAASACAPGAEVFVQEPRLGTAHAVLAAREAIARGFDDVLVMFGDTPLIDAGALMVARAKLAEGCAVSVVGFRTDRPTGYGRLIEQDGALVAIREDEGLFARRTPHRVLQQRADGDFRSACAGTPRQGGEQQRQGRILPDGHCRDRPRRPACKVAATETPFESTLGVNTLVELAEAEAVWQRRRRREAMLSGVTLIAPETVYFSHDTEDRPGCLSRTERLLRPRRESRLRRGHPRLLPHRGRGYRTRQRSRTVRAPAPRRRSGRGRRRSAISAR